MRTSPTRLIKYDRVSSGVFIVLLEAGRKVEIEVNSEENKYLLVSHQQTGGQNNIRVANKSF